MNDRTSTQDPTTLTRIVRIALWVLVGITIISVISDLLQYRLIQSRNFDMASAEANDTRQRVIGVAYVLSYLVTAVLFLKWIHRANLNARSLGAKDLRFSPGWAVGWYFIPFMNLVRPYQAMKEIWQASKNPENWSTEPAPPILGWWWALFLVSGFLGQTALRMSIQANSLSALSNATLVSVLAGLVDFPLCFVALNLVTDIDRMQGSRMGRSI